QERGVLYIAMEYLRGVTLHHLMGQVRRRGEAVPPDLWAQVLAQVCEGLHAAHELRDGAGLLRNVVHRDVSPSNVMISPEGQVKLIDFGVARAEGRLCATNVGQIKGKLAYMAPEQLRGEGPVDRRADLFSTGVVLFELCTGQRLFLRENDMATVAAVTQGT